MTIRTILSKPFSVVWFRLVQLLRLKIYHKTGFWHKVEVRVSKKVTSKGSSWKQKSLLFFDSQEVSDIPFTQESIKTTKRDAEAILQGYISIFDVVYKFDLPFKWNEDWRSGHTWEPKYFKGYSFYEKNKTIEYDVKFPWELSRLSFLIVVARQYMLEGNEAHLDYLNKVLSDWKKRNPIAHSVNWYPMEVSVRSINLIQLRELLLHAPSTDPTIDLLNEILILHGIFLWRNIEYTDVRGNHYTANLTSLLLLGSAFDGFYKEAKKWKEYALSRIEKEFHLQFIEDGVNFEKSISYHRLVVEFYLICFLVMRRMGSDLNAKTDKIFKNACQFIKDYTKPSGSTPIIGDNDSASVFQNDALSLNDHSNVLQLASLFFDDKNLNITSKTYNTAVELFGAEQVKGLPYDQTGNFRLHSYPKGGFAMVKQDKDYFIVDVGEVGMNGRGGHGHNDLFSFELMLDSQDIIVDPGSYTYTGDLKLKNEMKSSCYHNVLTVDEQEIAPLLGDWGISNSASPYDIEISEEPERITISGKHGGYQRLVQPVEHKRAFNIEKEGFTLRCYDTITCNSEHTVARHLHFSEHCQLKIIGHQVIVESGKAKCVVTFDEGADSRIEDFWLSYNYGHKISSQKLILENKVFKESELHFTIEKLGNDE